MTKRKIAVILLLPAAILLEGCLAFMASQLGYMEAKEKYSKLYDNYKSGQREVNQPVKEFNDWIKEQPLNSNEIKVFKYRGVISSQDARDIRERETMEKPGE